MGAESASWGGSATPPHRKTRVFISFDYDHDLGLKNLLVGQSRNEDSPFFIEDWSIKYASRGWRADARRRIRRADQVLVICGYHTHEAIGVGAELKIAREEGKHYFLLRGHKAGRVRRPPDTSSSERVHPWTWVTIRAMATRAR